MPGTNSTEIKDSGVDDTSGISSAGIGNNNGGTTAAAVAPASGGMGNGGRCR